MIKREKIFITGVVQGVGFRPAVYRIARELDLSGFVCNTGEGVEAELQGQEEGIVRFFEKLTGEDKPPLAQIRNIVTKDAAVIEGERDFVIRESRVGGAASSEETADVAVCDACLAELNERSDFRYRYPFINCTNCGPRYSIVKTIPYDRVNTTMSVFAMCGKCAAQYKDVADRRFHAQPVACGVCGPKVWLADNKGRTIEADGDKAIAGTARMLLEGRIAAIKGVGGFHLAVDALNEGSVEELRQRKRREGKPFAMMTDSVERIKKYAVVSEEAEKVLKSPQRPIVLLAKRDGAAIAKSVAGGTNAFGFMLCYAPLHYLLFAEGLEVLVMTSGYMSDEPLICKNDEAVLRLGGVADVFLMHDREIFRQVDDSIVHFVGGEPVLLRRARGFVPTPIVVREKTSRDILAAGADMKNTFCLVKRNNLICSEHIGDLEDAEVFGHYVKSIEHFGRLFEVRPEAVVYDLHPGYFSSRFALSIPDVKRIQVQHHWAHIASVLAERGLSGPVIGIAADGTGYGEDGAVWGCECLIATLERFERIGHLDYFRLAGADKASREAIRPVLGLLRLTYGEDLRLEDFGWLLERIEPDRKKAEIIRQQIERRVNTVETSSLGRVFDAVAAMLGLGSVNYFEAQLPMALESAAADGVDDRYDFEIIRNGDKQIRLDLRKMIKQIIADVQHETEVSIIAAKFHNCLAAGLAGMAEFAREESGIKTVAISGGCFCNRYLANRLIEHLRKKDFEVLFNKDFPANDGGISVGQAAIASLVTRGS